MAKPLTLNHSSENFSSYSNNNDKKEILIGENSEAIVTAANLSDYYEKISNTNEEFESKISYVHELAHFYEDNSNTINEVSHTFLKRRGFYNPSNKRLLVDNGYIYEDHFASFYTGRVYTNDVQISSEVFSTGMESTFLGTNGSLIGLSVPITKEEGGLVIHFNPDPEHRNLIVGILATINLPKERTAINNFLSKLKIK